MSKSMILGVTMGVLATGAGAADLTIVPDESELVVVLRGGGMGHDHAIRAGAVTGRVTWTPTEPATSAIAVVVPVAELVVDETELRTRYGLEKEMSDKDRRKITETMLSAKQLHADRFPEITFESTSIEATDDGWQLRGLFTMHGVSREMTLAIDVAPSHEGGFIGESKIETTLTSFDIEPFSMFFGAVKVLDEIVIHVRLVAR